MLLALLFSACAAAPILARDVSPETVVVVRPARLLDVRAGAYVDQPDVVVRGRKIESIAKRGAASVAPGTAIIALPDLTLLPGLIDCHTHLTTQIDAKSAEAPVHDTTADMAIQGVRHARITLRAGFTTVRDVGSSDYIDVALMHAIERGDIEGPWIFPAGHPIGITGGHADVTGFRPGILPQTPTEGIANGTDQCLAAVREQIKYGAKVIKIMATAGVLSFEETVGAQQMSFEEMKTVVDEAARHGLKVAAHAHGAEGIKQAVKAGVASIEHGSLLDDEGIDLMLQHGTFLVPTQYLSHRLDLSILPEVQRKKAEYLFPRKDECLKKAIRRGVKIAFGTDAGVYPHGENAKEFAVLVEMGMKPIDAIRAATTSAAELIGVADRGTIEAEKLADLVAVPGDPLTDVTALERVAWVMHGGQVVQR